MASRSLAFRSLAPIAGSSRTFASTNAMHAGAGSVGQKKTNAAAKPQVKKKTVLTKNRPEREVMSGGGGGGSGTKAGKAAKLDYSMASEIPTLAGVVEFSPERLMEDNVGLPTLFPVSTLGELKPFGLPRQLDKELTSYGPPASVVRYATLGMKHILESGASQSSEEARYLLTGHRGSGKSFLLLQTVCQALVNNWIVLYFPRTGAWIDSTFSYEYNAESQTFHQPSLALHILQTIASVNGSELSKIPSPNKDGTLADFIRKIKKEEHAVKGLEQVMTALASQTQVPVLLAMDDAHTLFATSKYRSPDYEKLRSYHMSTPLLMLDYLTARKTFNRGMVISALSYSDTVFYPSLSLEHGLGLESDRHLDPYDTIDPTHYAHATSGIKKIHLPYGMSTKEAAGMFEIWSRKGIVRRSTDETFMGTFAAAAGNPKEMRRGVHLTIQAYNYSPAGLHE